MGVVIDQLCSSTQLLLKLIWIMTILTMMRGGGGQVSESFIEFCHANPVLIDRIRNFEISIPVINNRNRIFQSALRFRFSGSGLTLFMHCSLAHKKSPIVIEVNMDYDNINYDEGWGGAGF